VIIMGPAPVPFHAYSQITLHIILLTATYLFLVLGLEFV
jgi:hypothetical protein